MPSDSAADRKGPVPPFGAAAWQRRLYIIIFEADTPGGRLFDVALLVAIVLSVLLVSLESVAEVRVAYGRPLMVLEWILTGLFTLEYVLRVLCVARRGRYVLSFFGIVDLCSLLPSYLALMAPGAHSLVVIRTLRLLRMFRVLKLVQFSREANALAAALRASRSKITVFLLAVSTLIMISGTVMYLLEGGADSGFTSIPRSMYWAVVTMTTVGYGDIAPATAVGQVFGSLLMIAGYAIIAVPTGIVTAEMTREARSTGVLRCPSCGRGEHIASARCCMFCGAELRAQS